MKLLFLLLSLPLSAGLVFETQEIKTTASPVAKEVTLEFPFTVKDAPAEILSQETPCTCLSATIFPLNPDKSTRLKWEPGQSGKVVAKFEVGSFKGTQSKAILLHMKGKKDPIQLVATITIPILLDIQPATQKWPAGSPLETRVFKLTVPGKDPVQILETSGTNKNFPFELKTIKPGREWEIHVAPKQTEKPAFGMIRLKTDSKVPRYQNAQVFVVVEKQK